MFFDLTDEEFASIYLIDIVPEATEVEETPLRSLNVPSSVDWRSNNAVTPVKD
jgi:hypothetical protein